MSPPDARVLSLASELERDWTSVESHRTRSLEVDPHASGPNRAYVAVALDHAYEAFESFLVRAARGLGLPLPVGDRWHVEILRAFAEEIAGVRPAVVPPEVLDDWEQLLGFRHFFRHAYRVELDPAKLAVNVERLGRAVGATRPMAVALVEALRSSP